MKEAGFESGLETTLSLDAGTATVGGPALHSEAMKKAITGGEFWFHREADDRQFAKG